MNEKRNGKRTAAGTVILGILAALAATLLLTGCPKKAVAPVAPETPSAVQPQAPEEAPGEPVMRVEPALEGAGRAAGTTSAQAVSAIEETDIFFEFDSFDLSPTAKKTLADKAAYLKAHQGIKVQIEGHCDERGTVEYNLALGERRAKAAYEYLVFLGVDPKRLSIVSYGEERPVDPGHNEEAWAKNRRAHFAVSQGY
ncbi:MAG TPA: peptidoglycan-associated lipoprotein Pal [Deltaproteobacteria bacterium]|nr:peptidoglycan-associated lipoprotein Pal [Deltaproteobacteria bacterium]HOM28916.1 peptidoglycan-associated lipoprotein Pal [Deltaproteobacteria bacterium]HPP80153.1 peptidoglycan-associated lipoprotein Pal [Deltaproteobacteria bacterium]